MKRFQWVACLSTLLLATTPALAQSQLSPTTGQILISRVGNSWKISESGRLHQGKQYTQEFRGEANQTIIISASSRQFDTYLELYDSDGRLLAQNDDADAFGNSWVQTTLPRSGTYTIVVKGANRKAKGNFTVTVQAHFSSTPERKKIQQTNHLLPGEKIQHSFPAEAGETIQIRVESKQFAPVLKLYGPDGKKLAVSHQSSQDYSKIQLRLPQSGVYYAEVQATSAQMQGDYVLTIGR